MRSAFSARMLLKGNLSRGVGLCLLLLALLHKATGQRRKAGRRNNYKLHDDGGNGNSSDEVSTCRWWKLVTGFHGEGQSVKSERVKSGQ